MIYYYNDSSENKILMSTTNHAGYSRRSTWEQVCDGKKVVLQDNPFVLEADDAVSLFSGCTGIENLEYLDISACEDLSYMFSSYNNSTLNLSWLDVSNVTNMNSMFTNSSIVRLNLTGWNVSKVRNFDYMFYNSGSLRNIYVDSGTNWQTATGGQASSYNMFNDCILLPNYSSSNWDINMANSDGGYFSVREPKWFRCTPYIKENDVWVEIEDVYK